MNEIKYCREVFVHLSKLSREQECRMQERCIHRQRMLLALASFPKLKMLSKKSITPFMLSPSHQTDSNYQ